MATWLRDDLAEALRAAIRAQPEDGGTALKDALVGRHPADVAAAVRELSLPEALIVFGWLDNPHAAEVLGELDPQLTQYLVERVPTTRMADLLDRLPMDDAAEVVAEVDPARSAQLLTDLSRRAPGDAAEVRTLLGFPEGSTGRVMTDKFAAVPPNVTVAQALRYLRSNAQVLETVDSVYVVEGADRLAGVCPLRRLLTAGEWQRMSEIMVPPPATVTPETDQETCARLIARYDLSAMPVMNPTGHLLGIVTVDDAIDILVEEFTEDYLHLAGADAEAMDRRNPIEIARLRLPWLLGTMGIELLSGLVISYFSSVLKEVILLASFMPVISAISGNVGLQSAAIVVRGLDTGHVTMRRWWPQVSKELRTSLLLAGACGLVLGGIGALWSRHLPFGIVIGVALLCSMLTAGLMGTVIPMVSKRLGFDPATTAGPFETAFQDVIGFAVFLWLASVLLAWLS